MRAVINGAAMNRTTWMWAIASVAMLLASPALAQDAPVRSVQRFMVGGNLGWNSLTGLGVVATGHITPMIGVDLGVGMSGMGIKAGGRVRGTLSESRTPPYVAAGAFDTSGSMGGPVENVEDGNAISFELLPSTFGMFVVGVDHTAASGLVVHAEVGYARLLTGDNVKMLTGKINAMQQMTFDLMYTSGVAVAVTVGWSDGDSDN